jgi:hypothetical protein
MASVAQQRVMPVATENVVVTRGRGGIAVTVQSVVVAIAADVVVAACTSDFVLADTTKEIVVVVIPFKLVANLVAITAVFVTGGLYIEFVES